MAGKGSGERPGRGQSVDAGADPVQRRRSSRQDEDSEFSGRAPEPNWPKYWTEGDRPTAAGPRPDAALALGNTDRLPTEELSTGAQPTDRHRLGQSADAVNTTELPVAADADSIPTRVLSTDAHRAFSQDVLDREGSMLSLHLTPYELSYLAARVGVDWRSLGGPDAGKAEKCGRLLAWAEEAGQRDLLLQGARRMDPGAWAKLDANPGYPARVRLPRFSLVASDDARRVARLLSAHYPVEDLRDLALNILVRHGVDWDDLAAATVGKSERIHALVAYAERDGFLHSLMAAARELDPEPWVQFDADAHYPPRLAVPTRARAPSPAALRAAAVLSRHYGEEELRVFSDDALDGLGLDWDDFGGSAVGRSERTLRLVCWAENVGLFHELLDVARQHKPGAWLEYDEDPDAATPLGPLPLEHPALDEGDLRIASALTLRFSRGQLKALAYEIFHSALGLEWTDFGGPGTTKREWVERVVWYAREVGLLNALLGLARDRQLPR
ncbi:MAG TPA: hypothetical protein VIG99_15095 [Myxococcaceae bacterium]|jgi:hypothetical protein